ncbi:MAG: hypothetical protein KDJ37_15175 [Hyphomicrobiaceae bacterium]|nr:hypothetical protein [Hyphomicrobiaceae bacterium]
MPSLFRFLFITGFLSACAFAGLYVLANYFEPKQTVVTEPVHGIKIHRP